MDEEHGLTALERWAVVAIVAALSMWALGLTAYALHRVLSP